MSPAGLTPTTTSPLSWSSTWTSWAIINNQKCKSLKQFEEGAWTLGELLWGRLEHGSRNLGWTPAASFTSSWDKYQSLLGEKPLQSRLILIISTHILFVLFFITHWTRSDYYSKEISTLVRVSSALPSKFIAGNEPFYKMWNWNEVTAMKPL